MLGAPRASIQRSSSVSSRRSSASLCNREPLSNSSPLAVCALLHRAEPRRVPGYTQRAIRQYPIRRRVRTHTPQPRAHHVSLFSHDCSPVTLAVMTALIAGR